MLAKLFIEENEFSNSSEEIPSVVTKAIDKRWLVVFYKQPWPVSFVQEFYLGILRGKTISFSSFEINDIYALIDHNLKDTLTRIFHPIKEQVRESLAFVAIRGVEFEKGEKEGYKPIVRKEIQEEMEVWLYFIIKRIMPTRHHTTISIERVMLVLDAHSCSCCSLSLSLLTLALAACCSTPVLAAHYRSRCSLSLSLNDSRCSLSLSLQMLTARQHISKLRFFRKVALAACCYIKTKLLISEEGGEKREKKRRLTKKRGKKKRRELKSERLGKRDLL